DWHMLKVFYRPDRLQCVPDTVLDVAEIQQEMGWCDDPDHADYNKLIQLPHPAHHERLWREDHIYDIVVQLDHNTAPIQSGAGSAIFMHVAKSDYSPTEGCIALNQNDLLELLRNCNGDTVIHVPKPTV
ncbi:MAG: L,D-transpeptidase family protein, partial [Magnetovibrio sp.]|nr:L,D-transpeptidase family protein [Magnetovibrio sp.]